MFHLLFQVPFYGQSLDLVHYLIIEAVVIRPEFDRVADLLSNKYVKDIKKEAAHGFHLFLVGSK